MGEMLVSTHDPLALLASLTSPVYFVSHVDSSSDRCTSKVYLLVALASVMRLCSQFTVMFSSVLTVVGVEISQTGRQLQPSTGEASLF